MANKSKTQLASVSTDTVRKAATQTVAAVVACEGAKVRLLEAVAKAVSAIGQPLTAKQYDRQFRPFLDKGFARAEALGKLKDGTGKQYASKLKTAVLAILSKAAEPVAGESFWAFYDRAAQALPSAKLSNGAPVWEVSAKRGRKVGAKQPPKAGGAMPKAIAEANASLSADKVEGGFDRSPAIAAALILCKGNEARAQRLVMILQSYTAEFDKWAATVLTDADKAEIGKRSAPQTPEGREPDVVRIGDEPELDISKPIAAALVKAQRKANAKAA